MIAEKLQRVRQVAEANSLSLKIIAFLLLVPLFSTAADLRVVDKPAFSASPAELLAEAAAAAAGANHNAVFLLDEDRWIFDKNGDILRTKRIVFQVLTTSGVQSWSNFQWFWEPWHETRPTVRIRVISPDSSVHNLDQNTLIDAPANAESANIYSDGRLVKCPVPALVPGAVVEEEVQVSTSHLLTGTVRILSVARLDPVTLARIYLECPLEMPMRYSTFFLPGEKETKSTDGGKSRLTLEAGPLTPRTLPTAQLAADPSRIPHVVFSIGRSWKDLASEYNAIVEKQIANASVSEFVQTATAAPTDRPQTIERLVRELHQQIRYTGVEFGSAAIIPSAPADTLKRKYGDCKDKAALLVAMLRAAHIPAYLALLSAGSGADSDEQFPGFGLFNHAIVYVPGSPDLWIDATAQFLRSGFLPQADQGRRALIIRPETVGLTLIPDSPSSASRHIQTREFYLPEIGKSTVVVTNTGVGTAEAFLRSTFGSADTDTIHNALVKYARAVYGSESLARIEHPRGDDFSQPFHLRLEINDSQRGFVSQTDAAVAITFPELFEALPAYLKTEDEKASSGENSPASAPPPKNGVLLAESFVSECHYRIHLPLGFQVMKMPEPQTLQWGAATFSSHFRAEKDILTADFFFDTVKRRHTEQEVDELRKAVIEFSKKPLLISFQPAGMVFLASGKIREAIAQFRLMTDKFPQNALYHVRLSTALLAAGCGHQARTEALRATELDPKSAVAFQHLGLVLSNDLIGRHFGKGFDAAGAEAAYRKAVELDPKDSNAQRNLAAFLEYGPDGYHYSPGARLDEAVKILRGIDGNSSTKWETNLLYDLAYAGHFRELRSEAEKLPLTGSNLAFKLVATTKLESSSAALTQAEKETADESTRSLALAGAGDLLIKIRDYSAGADLLAASAKGADNPTQNMTRANLFRSVKRMENNEFRGDTPEHFIQSFFTSIVGGHMEVAFLQRSMAREALYGESPEEIADATAKFGSPAGVFAASSGLSTAVYFDMIGSLAEFKTDANGDDGYRVRMTIFNKTSSYFLTRQDKDYRILGSDSGYTGVARRVLANVRSNNLPAARHWLDWLRDEVKIAGGDDPLDGLVFPRIWSKGALGDASAINYAAATLLGFYTHGEDLIPLLSKSLESFKEEPGRSYAQLAYVHACVAARRWPEALRVAKPLADAHPESPSVSILLMRIYLELKKWDDLQRIADQRLARDPDEAQTSRMLAVAQIAQSKFSESEALFRKIASSSKGTAADWNEVGWLSLFAGDLTPETTSRLQRELANAPNGDLQHTLAAMYAEQGKTTEARETILAAMRSWQIEEPNSSSWFIFGRLAEEFGVIDEALLDYQKVTPDDRGVSSTFALTQRRMALLKK